MAGDDLADELAQNLEEEVAQREVSLQPSDMADSAALVHEKIPPDILERYEVHSYRNAAVILSEARAAEFADLLVALRAFTITTKMIRTAGGNESDIPRQLAAALRPRGWHPTNVRGDLVVQLMWSEQTGVTSLGNPMIEGKTREIRRERFIDGHKIDYVKGKVAFDVEWNTKIRRSIETCMRSAHSRSAVSSTSLSC